MKTMKNSISTAVIMVLAMSVAVIGPAQAMAKERKQRARVAMQDFHVTKLAKTRRSSSTLSRRGNIKDGTSNTLMVGERSSKGIISPRDSASGLPTGIVSNNRALKGRKNPNPPGGWATFPSSRRGRR